MFKQEFSKKFYIIFIFIITLTFTTKAIASLTFTTNAITGTTASTIDLGAGNNLSLQTSGGNVGIGSSSNFYYDGTNQQLRVGDNASSGLFFNGQGQFQARRENANSTIRIVTVGTTQQNYLAFDRSRGTFASPTSLLNGDIFGSIVGVGNYGDVVSLAHGPEIRFTTNEDWTVTNKGSSMQFYAIPKNTASQVLSMTIDPDLSGNGVVRIQTVNSTNRVTGLQLANVATGANTAISLDFLPGGNLSFPLARINAQRITGGAGDTDIIFSNWNGSSLLERMRIVGLSGSVGIGTTSPNANAILDVSSTTKAFMPPRMTTTQRDAIPSPTAGMVTYNTTTNKLNVYTTTWEAVTSS